MTLFIGTGKIDPTSLKFDSPGLSVCFALQDGPARYDIESHGIEQYRLLETIIPGEVVVVVGGGEQRNGNGRARLVIRPILLLRLGDLTIEERQILLQVAKQVIESHLEVKK